MTEHTTLELVEAAVRASQQAYIPYSGYPVGAALMASDGRVYTGCNVENASYSVTICAERTALVKAVSEGARSFERLAVVTFNAGAPCGVCRQALYEFAPELRVIIATLEGEIHHDLPLSALLPHGFGPGDLPE